MDTEVYVDPEETEDPILTNINFNIDKVRNLQPD